MIKVWQQVLLTALLLLLVGVAGGCSESLTAHEPSRRRVNQSSVELVASSRRGDVSLSNGERYVHTRDVTADGVIVDRYQDSGGNWLDADEFVAVRSASARRRWNRLGCLSDALWRRVRDGGEAPIRVQIWPALHRVPRRGSARDEAVCDEVRDVVNRIHASLGEPIPSGRGECPIPLQERSLTPHELNALAWSRDIALVDVKHDVARASYYWMDTIGATVVHPMGWTGAGYTVGVVEPAGFDTTVGLSGIIAVRFPTGLVDDHARSVTAMVRQSVAPYGVAPGAGIVLGNCAVGSSCVPGAAQWAIDQGADVLNESTAPTSLFDAPPGAMDRYRDWLILQFPYPLYVMAAGNILSPADPEYVGNRHYNGIIVGAAADGPGWNYTSTPTDDVMWNGSRWRNYTSPSHDRELPEIVSQGSCVENVTFACLFGTSVASPQIAGGVALLHQRNPFNLAAGNWPEAQKAILMSSVDCNVDGPILDLGDSTDDRDGIGEMNLSNALALANPSNSNFGSSATSQGFRYGSFYPADFSGGSWSQVPRVLTGSSGWVNVVVVWDATPICTPDGTGSYTCGDYGPDADINLLLVDDVTGVVAASSTSVDNTYEAIVRQLTPNHTYRIVVNASSWRTSSTFYGLAWSTNSQICRGI